MTTDEICLYIQELHDIDSYFEGDIEERVEKYSHFELEIIEIRFLDEQWSTCEETYREYAEMNSSMPPIVIGELGNNIYDIIDGSHRIESAKINKQTKIKAYVGKL